jgi:hypothetical protein
MNLVLKSKYVNYLNLPYYILPLVNQRNSKVSDGIFYTEPRKRYKNSSGTIISKTQTIYLFNQWSDLKGCSRESDCH